MTGTKCLQDITFRATRCLLDVPYLASFQFAVEHHLLSVFCNLLLFLELTEPQVGWASPSGISVLETIYCVTHIPEVLLTLHR